MKKLFLNIALLLTATTLTAQTQAFPNGGFENWNGSGTTLLPVDFHSNKDGGGSASLGAQTAFQEATGPHSGTYCVRIETVKYLNGLVKINGSLTTGYVNAPSTTKSEGYVGTTKYQGDATDIRRIDFTSRPDSLVGYFKYTKGGTNEAAKVRVILHKDHYYDPETPATNNYTDPSANKIGDALFISASQDFTGWTRFSVPFNYVSTDSPEYVLVTATSSADQETNIAGSKLWLDDLQFIYNDLAVNTTTKDNFNVFSKGQQVIVDLTNVSIENGIISIYDMSGRKITTSKLTTNSLNTVNLPNSLTTGVYMYQIEGNGVIKTGKLAF